MRFKIDKLTAAALGVFGVASLVLLFQLGATPARANNQNLCQDHVGSCKDYQCDDQTKVCTSSAFKDDTGYQCFCG